MCQQQPTPSPVSSCSRVHLVCVLTTSSARLAVCRSATMSSVDPAYQGTFSPLVRLKLCSDSEYSGQCVKCDGTQWNRIILVLFLSWLFVFANYHLAKKSGSG